MAQHDDIDDIPSLVPERDELVTHRKRKRGTSASSPTASIPVAQEVVAQRTSGLVIFFITLLVIGMGATGAAGYYFYQDSLATKDELLKAADRIAQLETTLSLTSQEQTQAAGDLIEKIEFNFSEVDKLWAARNVLRGEVDKLNTDVTQLKTVSGELQESVSNHEKVLSDNVATIEARIEEINRNFAGMDNLGEQLTVLNADLNRVKTAMGSVEENVEARLATTEQDIESINVYRLQLNQTIATLQDSVNSLQQRLGQ